tara:strand:+ start:311 stop:1636 length:1326 start_codon:yes stop_codon:yes gene_type:complete
MPEEQSRAQQIGLGLQAFGAGVQGTLPQFQQAQNQKQQMAQNEQRDQQQQIRQAQQDQYVADDRQLAADDRENAKQLQVAQFGANVAKQALELANAGEWEQAVQLSTQATQQMQHLGLPVEGSQQMSQLFLAAKNGSEEAGQLAINELNTAVSMGERMGWIESAKGASDPGKLGEDLAAGLITQEQYDNAIAVINQGTIGRGQISTPQQVKDEDGNLFNSQTVFNPNTNKTTQVLTPLSGGGPQTPVGEVQMVNAEGQTPEEQIIHSGMVAGTQAAAVAAIKKSEEAFGQLAGIESQIATLDEALVLLDEEGVDTGPILNRLPTLRSAAVQLKQIQGELALDVIQNTTFGSLSEAELQFALDVGLPGALQPAELKAWIIRKQGAQRKLASHIAEASIFLGTPGNNIADWLTFQENRQIVEAAARVNGNSIITFDAAGNPTE